MRRVRSPTYDGADRERPLPRLADSRYLWPPRGLLNSIGRAAYRNTSRSRYRRDTRRGPFRCRPHPIFRQVGVLLGGARLHMPERLPDNVGQGAVRDGKRCDGVPQIAYPEPGLPGALVHPIPILVDSGMVLVAAPGWQHRIRCYAATRPLTARLRLSRRPPGDPSPNRAVTYCAP
jgi:hypothetical protein